MIKVPRDSIVEIKDLPVNDTYIKLQVDMGLLAVEVDPPAVKLQVVTSSNLPVTINYSIKVSS